MIYLSVSENKMGYVCYNQVKPPPQQWYHTSAATAEIEVMLQPSRPHRASPSQYANTYVICFTHTQVRGIAESRRRKICEHESTMEEMRVKLEATEGELSESQRLVFELKKELRAAQSPPANTSTLPIQVNGRRTRAFKDHAYRAVPRRW